MRPSVDDTDLSPLGMASGKVILLGEHAVVYGVPALAVGIDRGAHARAYPHACGPSELFVRDWGITVRETDPEPMLACAFAELVKATRASLDQAGRTLGPVRVEAGSELPPGGGLGCSAATGVAVARALDPLASPGEICDRVMVWERVFHGNPSGVDAAVATRGGCLYFEKGRPVTPVRARHDLLLCLGSTGLASSTKSMVLAVARQRQRRPAEVDAIFEQIGCLVRQARATLEASDTSTLGSLLDQNQALLARLSLSSPEIDALCGAAHQAGALGAKLTGAGGGGSVVALVSTLEEGERVLASWKKAGFGGFAARVRGASASSQPRLHGDLGP